MNNKKSTHTIYKRLISKPEFTKVADSRRSELASGLHQNSKKKLDLSDQSISLPALTSSMPSFPSGRGVIDAQTYVDAQSNGFTKRIVRYDEESKKIPKVYNRIYKRPGDFPIVHLDKPKLILTPKRSIANPPKMARIGQPEASSYQTSIRAEILRNGTLMPQQISVDRLEDVDTVRVDPLDALKEISRKRIHCEDTINQIQSAPIEKDSTDSIPCGTNYNKRQRTSFSETNKKGNNSSKCNEILSSLSSSSYMLSPLSPTSKRADINSPSSSVLSPPKRLQSDKPIEASTIETTIDSVPKTVEKIVPEVVDKIRPTEPTQPKLTLFNRPYTANSPVLPPVSNDRNDECSIPFVVKPRPMTARSRESVENWLKMKPDEKRRLALMLSCLSGEVDDGDTVDSKDQVNETPASNSIVATDNFSKEVRGEKNTAESSITAPVTPTTQINDSSTTASLLPSKPVITFSPISTTSTTTTTPVSLPLTAATQAVLPTSTTVQTGQAIEERKGGFSFPMATKEIPHTAAIVSPKPTSGSSTVILASSPVTPALATVTTSPITSTNIISTDSIPTSTPSVTFTFHQPKPKVASPVVSSVEPTKTFSFGNVSTTNEPKTMPAFGLFATVDPAKQTTSVSGTFLDPKKSLGLDDTSKPTSFAAFGQTTSIGNVDFGKPKLANTLPSTVAASTASIFGTMTSSSAFNKAQPPSFGSISTTQQTISNDKPIQSNMIPTFGKIEQTPVFGNNATLNTQKQADPRTSNNATATSFISNQLVNPTTTTSFAFPAFKTAQPTFSSDSCFGRKPIDFGSSTTAPMFGSSTNTISFDQTPKVGPIKTTLQNPAEPERNPTQGIFGSTAANPSSTFSFSSNQPNANNIFGGQTTAENGTGNAFNFGVSIQKSDLSSGSIVGTNKSFSFSGNNGETTKPVAFGSKTNAPTFGSSNITDSAKSVGFAGNNQTSATNLFNNKSSNDVPKPFSFGNNTNTPAVGAAATFGGIGMTSSFVGSSAVPSSNATTPFGGTNATPIFGNTNAPATFVGNSNATTFGRNATTFGDNATTFGTNSGAQFFGTTNVPSVFGVDSATSVFGVNSATSGFVVNNTSAFAVTAAPSSFGSTNTRSAFETNNTNSSFGVTNAMQPYGGAQNYNSNIGTATFGTTPNSSNGSSFGNNSGTAAFTTSTGTADVNKTFNFTGSDPAPSPVQNLFNSGPVNPAPRGRTIRTAARRTYR